MKFKFDPNKVNPNDWKFVAPDPDPDFSAEHNNEVIERTIKEAERMARAKKREFQEGLAERTEALSKYLKSVEAGGKESDVTRYFGKKYKGYLAGKYAIERIKDGLTSLDSQGRVIRTPGQVVE